MTSIRLGPHASDFIWATGIEDTFVPQTRPGHRALDEYELMGHYEHWREDLALLRDLGVAAVRWGVPWYRVEPRQGEFDWSWTDQVIPYIVEDLGVTLITDLMHYGTPFWLEREFANRDYPKAVAAYAGAFARRYSSLIKWYTPLNEPLINALMCGRRGLWPPYLRGDQGYIRVMMQLIQGILLTVDALKEADPDAIMVHVEATGLRRTALDDLLPITVEDELRHYLAFDLLVGSVTPSHPLFTWLARNGTNPLDLRDIARRAIPLDVIGLNFYPQWATKELYIKPTGKLGYRNTEKEGTGFEAMIEAHSRRYGVPIMITETSAKGPPAVRQRWLAASVEAVKRLRGRGVPLVGYTWFPLFTMIDWKYRFGKLPLEKYRLELGFYTLDERATGSRWRPTALVEQYQRYVANPAEAIGSIVTEEPMRVSDPAL